MKTGIRSATPQERAPTLLESLKILFGASRGYWLVSLVNFGDGVAYFGILALMTLFLERDIGFSIVGSARAVSLFTGAVTVFMALGGGVVSDRLGVRRALSLCLGLLVIGRVLFVLTPEVGPSSWMLGMAWTSLLVMAAGEGIIQPALYSGIKEYTDSRTETLGYAFLYSIMNLGIVAGELLSPALRKGWATHVEGQSVESDPAAGISGALWFFIAASVVMLAINLLWFTRRVELRDRKVVERPPERVSGTWRERLRELPILDPRFQFFIFVLLPVRTLFAHQWLTLPHFVTRVFPPAVGAKWEWINGLNPLVIVVFVPLIAALTQKRRVIDMMIVGTAVSALSTFLLAGQPSVSMLLGYIVIFSLGEAVWSSRFLEYVAKIAPAHRIGVYMGIATIPWFLAKTVTGFYSGEMLEFFVPESGPQSPGTLWLIYGATALISPLGLLFARRWLLESVQEKGVGQRPARSG